LLRSSAPFLATVSNVAHDQNFSEGGGTPLPYCGTLPIAEKSTVENSARDVTRLRRGSYVHASNRHNKTPASAGGWK
jgi:hypothetical protein